MRHLQPVLILAVGLAIVSLASPTVNGANKSPRQTDEEAIRQSSKAFVKAFNARDARAVAAQWTEDGDYMDETGQVYRGRDEIRREFQNYFARSKGRTIKVYLNSIRFLKPDVAIIDGVSEVSPAPEGRPGNGRYSIVRVKQSGKWLVASVRETAQYVPSNYEHLKELEWLVGEWVDESGDVAVHTTAQWSRNKNFIVRTFTVKVGDRPMVSGTQRIGWDPQRGQIKSWVFDSDGSVGEGLWVRKGNAWTVRKTLTLLDDGEASSTNTITKVDDDTIQWKSVNRVIDGQAQPDIVDVRVVRMPPKPM